VLNAERGGFIRTVAAVDLSLSASGVVLGAGRLCGRHDLECNWHALYASFMVGRSCRPGWKGHKFSAVMDFSGLSMFGNELGIAEELTAGKAVI